MTLVLVVAFVFMYCVVSYHGNKKSSSSLLMISYSCTINLTCTLLCVLDFNTLLKSNRSFSLSTAKHYFIACVSFWINVLPFFSFVVMGLQDFIIHIIKIVLCHKYFPNSSLCGCMIPTCIAVVPLFPGPCPSWLHKECRGYNNNNNDEFIIVTCIQAAQLTPWLISHLY